MLDRNIKCQCQWSSSKRNVGKLLINLFHPSFQSLYGNRERVGLNKLSICVHRWLIVCMKAAVILQAKADEIERCLRLYIFQFFMKCASGQKRFSEYIILLLNFVHQWIMRFVFSSKTVESGEVSNRNEKLQLTLMKAVTELDRWKLNSPLQNPTIICLRKHLADLLNAYVKPSTTQGKNAEPLKVKVSLFYPRNVSSTPGVAEWHENWFNFSAFVLTKLFCNVFIWRSLKQRKESHHLYTRLQISHSIQHSFCFQFYISSLFFPL